LFAERHLDREVIILCDIERWHRESDAAADQSTGLTAEAGIGDLGERDWLVM
jgi:hypothetical protein